ncbi:hypothetical protein ACIQVC_37275 [Streptomyces sp. NPDC101112]|uniref:hypothetical protein n=1 Tax=Streptomyces sp. NPDC101112 TaxID=3366105 RepID=UPI0037F14175
MSQPDSTWSTCPTTTDHGPHHWRDPWPLPLGQDAHCPGRPTPEPDQGQAADDSCRAVDIDGDTIRVRGAGELTDQGRAALTEVVRAAKRRMAEEAFTADSSPLRDLITQALFDADDHIRPWRTADTDVKDQYGKRAEAVLAVVLPLGKFPGDQLRDTEAVLKNITALYELWVKAGPPPLGTSTSREWDRRLVELRAALSPSDQPDQEQDAPVDWQAIAEQRERELKTVGEARRRAEMAIARVLLIKKAPSRSPYNLAANAQDDGWDQALEAVHTALATPERCETKNARKDHSVHELLAALKAGVPHPDPVGLIGRYYQAIHELCCPYDHTEPRPGHAAAANRK